MCLARPRHSKVASVAGAASARGQGSVMGDAARDATTLKGSALCSQCGGGHGRCLNKAVALPGLLWLLCDE